ncbi:tubulin binding cofactor C-domain-containing protein [Chaetomium sp. MPI-SDFR-AT-0129]|nr:tubulin binding cofactor C-domain-containing protein [Chaetomium sp. MPI-SDFR-AT-0129]
MSAPDPKERFHRQFQVSVASIQEQIDRLFKLSTAGGEREDAVEHTLSCISHLSKDVADATDFLPAYDQRTYSDTVKSLKDQVNEAEVKFKPKSRFQFKKRTDNGSAVADKADTRRLDLAVNSNSSGQQPTEVKDTVGSLPSFTSTTTTGPTKNYNAEVTRQGEGGDHSGIRKPSFSTARDIDLSDHIRVHITLPASASRATSAGTLTDLHQCVVDMSLPTCTAPMDTSNAGPDAHIGTPFASLMLKEIKSSVIVAGHVNGPVHVTRVRDSVVVVIARQVRIHECRNVVFYLHCVSRPIVEDCKDVRFAKCPEIYLTDKERTEANLYDQVDDFKWLKTFSSPNWSLLPDSEVITDQVWKKALAGEPGTLIDDTLQTLGVNNKKA